jgi:hypothetical protein
MTRAAGITMCNANMACKTEAEYTAGVIDIFDQPSFMLCELSHAGFVIQAFAQGYSQKDRLSLHTRAFHAGGQGSDDPHAGHASSFRFTGSSGYVAGSQSSQRSPTFFERDRAIAEAI